MNLALKLTLNDGICWLLRRKLLHRKCAQCGQHRVDGIDAGQSGL
jgi:hypothetical protein